MKKHLVLALVVVLTAVLGTANAFAQFSFTITDPVQSAAPGQTVTYHAAVQNLGTEPVVIKNWTFQYPAEFVEYHPDYTVSWFLRSFAAGEVWTGPLVEVAVPSIAEMGRVWDFSLSFDYETGTQNPEDWGQVTAPYQLTIVPEPSSLLVLAGGLSGLMLRRKRTSK